MPRLSLETLVPLIADELEVDEDTVWNDIKARERGGLFSVYPITANDWALMMYTLASLGMKRANALQWSRDVVEKLGGALME